MDLIAIVIAAFIVLVAGAAVTAPLAAGKRLIGWVATLFVAAAAALTWLVAFRVIAGGPVASVSLFTLPGLGASLTLGIDGLSAIFLLLITGVSLVSAFYSIDYMTHYRGQNLARFYSPLLLFIAGMIGVVVVTDWFFFFIFWELMTLSSYFLVVFEKEKAESLKAGFKYFLMTHVATAGMFAAAIILWTRTGSFSFAAAQSGLVDLARTSALLFHFVLALWFGGFATKAGLYPVGDWLPDAHPAAPSGASALLSGVMIKLGVYGILRVFLGMLPAAANDTAIITWGAVIAGLGTISALVGSLTAVREDDCKRLLAFSSISQMGYILLAVGVALALRPISPPLAGLALLAGLFHLFNEAIFKALLFMNAGAVVYRTGTRDLNRVGGLGRIMPYTAGAALFAALALAGLPPLNGFASKWLIYQAAIFGGFRFPLFLALAIAALFISMVTLAYSLKFVGAAFLGKLAGAAETDREPGWTMTTAQLLLTLACVGIGLFPGVVLGLLRSACALLSPGPAALAAGPPYQMAFSLNGAVGAWNPALVTIVFLICGGLAYGLYRLGGAPVREVESWYGGEVHADELVRFRARGFYSPFGRAIARSYPMLRAPHVRVPRLLYRIADIDSWLYNPIVRAGKRLTTHFSRTHVGIPQMYMLWLVVGAALVVGLLFALVR